MSYEQKKTIWTNMLATKLSKLVDVGGVTIKQTFSISFRNGFSRIEVKLNDGASGGNYWDNNLQIPMNNTMLGLLGQYIIDVSNGKKLSTKLIFKNTAFTEDGKSKTAEIVVAGTIIVEYVGDRVILKVDVPGKEQVSFDVVVDPIWFKLENASGDDITNSKTTNEEFSTTYGNMLKELSIAYETGYSLVHRSNEK